MAKQNSVDLGVVNYLRSFTYGQPGNRTFKVVASSQRGTAWVWLEKEELGGAARAIRRNLDKIGKRTAAKPKETPTSTTEDHEQIPPDTEFKAQMLKLNYNLSEHLFTLYAGSHAAEDSDDAEDSDEENAEFVQFSFQIEQARLFVRETEQIVAAGRQRCIYCNTPVEKGTIHQCVRRNGHDSP